MKYIKGKKALALILAITMLMTNIQWGMLTVEAATTSLSVVWSDTELKYNATAQVPTATITVNGTAVVVDSIGETVLINDTLSVTMSVEVVVPDVSSTTTQSPTVVSTYYVAKLALSGTDSTSYTLSDSEEAYSIVTQELSGASVAVDLDDDSWDYTGSQITPVVTSVTVDDKSWTVDTDYTVSYGTNTAIGTGTVTITPTSTGTYSQYYTGTKEVTFSIVQKAITDVATITTVQGDDAQANWYAGDVTITSPTGYQIGTAIEGAWNSSLTYTTSQASDVSYYLKESATGAVSAEKTIESFNVDKIAPVISNLAVADGNEIKSEKTISFDITEDNVQKVSYTFDSTTTELTSNNTNYSFNATANGEYTITVLDKAGNVATDTITVSKIDTVPPTVTVGGVLLEEDSQVFYVKDEATFAFSFADSDAGLSTDSEAFQIQQGDETAEDLIHTSGAGSFTYTPTTLGTDEKVTYTITGKDSVGNEVTKKFTVIYDVTNPAVEEDSITVNGEAYAATTWLSASDFTGGTPTVTFTAADVASTSDTTSDYVSGIESVVLSDGETEVTLTEEDSVYSYTIPKEDFNGTYKITVTDKAGNSYKKELEINVDITAPTVTSASIDGSNNSVSTELWYNADGDITLSASVSDIASDGITVASGVEGVFATTEDDASAVASSFTAKTGSSLANYIEGTVSNGSYTFTITDADFATRKYYFYAYDEAGNLSAIDNTNTASLQRDSQAPGTNDIYISFTEVDDAKTISEFVANIFGKETVKATVYVKDPADSGVASGVTSVTLQYDGQDYITTIETSADSAKVDGIDGYDVFEFKLTKDADTEISDNIVITNITDLAGNVATTDGTTTSITSKNIVVLDDVAPVLQTVDYATDSKLEGANDTTYWFYNSATEVEISIDETNFATLLDSSDSDSYSLPSVKIDGTSVASTWNTSQGTSTLTFAEEAGEEKEYTFTVDYTDPSGNQMVSSTTEGAANYSVEAGIFTSDIIVIDDVAPVLSTFTVSGQGDASSTIDGVLYAENTEDNDVLIKVGIQDTETYFNEDNVVLKYSMDGGNWTELELDSSINYSNEGGEMVATYSFDGVVSEEHTYEFCVSYTDRAGNAMVLGNALGDSATGADGTFTNNISAVIDHKVPEVAGVSFSAPQSIYDGETKGDTITDAASKVYYDAEDSATVTLILTDGYLFTEDSVVTLYSRATSLDNWSDGAELSDVTYNNANGTISFAVPNTASEYKYTVSYADKAGNEMVYADEVTNTQGEAYTGGVTDGTYTTSIMVVDTVDPTIDVTYTAGDQTDVAIADLVKYQSGADITATVKVTDLNLDLANTSVTLTELDNNGEAVNGDDNTASTYSKSLADLIVAGLAYISDGDAATGTYTISIPLTSEAVYTVAVAAEDKAGNTSSYVETEDIYLDRTSPVIIAEVGEDGAYTAESDIQYTVTNDSTFAQFLNKITFGYFANSEVKVTVTAHDAISGVDTITLVCQDGDAVAAETTEKATVDGDDPSVASATFTVSPAFKGTIAAYATDNSGNADADNATAGISVIAQDTSTDATTSSITIAVAEDSIANATTPTYYNYDVDVVYTVEDSYSGINEIQYTAGTESIADFQTENTAGTPTDIDTEVEKTYTITAADNNTNNVLTGVTYTDNAGYETTIAAEDLPVINIDITVPTISVDYDNDDNYNTDYYDAVRIATLTITERNFDPDESTIVVTGGDYEVLGDAWTNASGTPGETDACTWTRQVELTGSGDYTLTCNTMDLAGNVAVELTDTFTIDLVDPTLTVEQGDTVLEDKAVVYTNDDITIDMLFADTESGIDYKSLSVTRDDQAVALDETEWTAEEVDSNGSYSNAFTFTPATVDAVEQADYVISATDMSGREVEKSITIIYETDKVIIGDITANGESDTEIWINGVDFAEGNQPTVQFYLDDEGLDPYVSGVASVELYKSGSADALVITSLGDGYYEYVIPEEDFSGSYTIIGIDNAGNESQSEFIVYVDVTEPEISEPTITGTNNEDDSNLWYNATDVGFEVTATDAGGSAVAGVFATTEDSIDVRATLDKLNSSNITAEEALDEISSLDNYLVGTQDGTDGTYTFEVADKNFNTRTYYFYTYDTAGNIVLCEESVALQRDSEMPKTDNVLVAYAINEEEPETATILDKFVDYISNIFGQDKVTVHVYVEDPETDDTVSRMEIVELDYNGVTYTGDRITKDDLVTITGVGEEGFYDVFEFELPATEEEAAEGDILSSGIQILHMEDIAGNISKDTEGTVVTLDSKNIVVIDNVEPVSTGITYDVDGDKEVVIGEETYWFDNADVDVDFTIDEHNFFTPLESDDSDSYIRPTMTVTGDTEQVTYQRDWTVEEGNVALGTANFALLDGETEETEYRFTLDYSDPSDNAMESTQSDVIVLDTIAPELVEFSIKDTAGTELDGDYLYAINNNEFDDVELTVVIEDNAKYFDASKVEVSYSVVGEDEWEFLTAVNDEWDVSDRNHTNTYIFDGVEDDEFTYQFRVTYTDRAGNTMVEADDSVTTVNAVENMDGTFEHDTYVVIDHEVPEMVAISFEAPKSIYDGDEDRDSNGTLIEEITDEDTRVYYDDYATISMTLEDDYLFTSESVVTLYERATKVAAWDNGTEVKDVEYSDGTTISFEVPNTDAEYYVTVSYADRAGNVMVYATEITNTMVESYDGGMIEGTYTTPIMVVDGTEPTVDVVYTAYDTDNQIIAGQEKVSIDELDKYQGGNEVTATITIIDQNLELEETYLSLTEKDINGNDIGSIANYYNEITLAELFEDDKATVTSQQDGTYQVEIDLSEEAVYTLGVEVVDKVGKTDTYEVTDNIYVDRTSPVIDASVDAYGFFDDDSDIQYEVINDGLFSNLINKITFGYFSKEAVLVTVTAHDAISGVDTITYTYDSEEAEDGTDTSAYTGTAKVTLSGDDKSQATITFELPASFKGSIEAYGTDMSSNVAEASDGLGVITETAAKDDATVSASVVVLTQEAKTENYYNTDVLVQYSAMDTYSGIYTLDYIAGSVAIDTADYSASGIGINTSEVVQNYNIVASLNNNNNVETGLTLTDNAGYVTTVAAEDLPTIHIDTTAPVIDVVYDNNDALNENYYKDTRTATVTITERNFDPDDTELVIEGEGVSISGWSHSGCAAGSDPDSAEHTDSCTWTCTVAFTQDGDYTFTCSTTDLAGNTTEYGQVDEFTIDMTLPTIGVTYNNNDSANSNYFSEGRTATITIDEHNFNASEVEVSMTASDNGATISTPSVSSWSTSGDIHTATIAFDYDGDFTLDVAYADLAGNEAEDFAEENFVIDLILPVIEIFDIEDKSANNGTVAPSITLTDTNYDLNSIVITLVGANNGIVEFGSTTTAIENGQTVVYANIPELVENDDLYTLTAVATDMAGNIFESSVMFSVNRFGSVFVLSEETAELTDAYYTNEETTLSIQEINVDTIEFQDITYMKDSDVVTLEMNSDYTVVESGSEATWKSYEYTIDADNFVEEGAYVVTITSEDSATNQMNNKMSEADIEFAIDKTAPSTVVTGVENDTQYNAATRELIVDAKDNMLLASVEIYVNGDETVYEYENAELTETNGLISVTLEDGIDWQTVKVVSTDAAGNMTASDEITYLITTNIFYQWYRNTVLFYGSIVTLLAVIGGATSLIVGKRRKKKEQK